MHIFHIHSSPWFYAFFIRFLKDSHIQPSRFFQNCNKCDNGKRLIRFLNAKSYENYGNIIDEAFYWADTPEGDAFWYSIHHRFQIQYQQYIKQLHQKKVYFI